MKTPLLALMAALAMGSAWSHPALAQSELNIALQDDPDTLDPATNWSFVGRHVLQSLCDKVVDIDETGKIVPMLAESWEWSEDGSELTLKLRDGVTFHDGTKFDAEAVKYNLNRNLTMETSRRKSEISAIDTMEVVDPMTLKITLKQPSVPLLAALSDRAGMMVSPKAGEELGTDFTNAPVCSGPYKFVEHVAQDRIVLEKFADYWRADQYNFDKLTYRGMPDSSVRLLNLRSGQIDFMERLSPTDVTTVEGDDSLEVDEVTGLGYYAITFDIGGKGADEDVAKLKAVRHAFDLAIDRDAINQVVFEGRYATGNQPFPPGSTYYNEDKPVQGRDVEAAKAALAEAGVENVTIDLLVPTDPERQQVAQLVQAMVGEIGIEVNVVTMELMTILEKGRQGEFEAHLVGWSGRVDPDLNITPMLSCGAAGNDAHYCNEKLDQILQEARATSDIEDRQAKYKEATTILLDELPLVYMYHSKWIYAFTDDLEGFKTYPDGIIRLNGVSLAE